MMALALSADLIEYLLNIAWATITRAIRYIEKVALAWAEEGITSVEEAKQSGSRYNKDYFSILKALGITNRNPVETEITLMDTWLRTYGFSIGGHPGSRNRTVLQTGQASFQYTDKILEGWKRKMYIQIDDTILWIPNTRNAVRTGKQHPPNLHSLPITVSITSSSENTTSTNMRSIY